MKVSELIIEVMKDTDLIDPLLEQLDKVAKSVDYYEFGLPLYSENKADLHLAVIKWLITLQEIK